MYNGSYQIKQIAENKDVEINRLKAQVDLFWGSERNRYALAGLKSNMSIIEFGSGPGFLTEKLLDEFSGCRITGIEIDYFLLNHARQYLTEKKKKNFVFIQSTIINCGIADNTFDFAIIRLVLEHIHNPMDALREVYRVLKPGGKAIFIDNDFDFHIVTSPDTPKLRSLYQAYSDARISEGGNPRIGRELPMLLKAGGFINVSLDTLVAHNSIVGDSIFFQSEGVGIPTRLVREGFLDSRTLGKIAFQWRKAIKNKNHSLCRLLFFAVGQKKAYKPESDEEYKNKVKNICTDTSLFSFVSSEIKSAVVEVLKKSNNAEMLPGNSASMLDLNASFLELGINSVGAVELVEMINANLNLKLGIETIFDYKDIHELTHHILDNDRTLCLKQWNLEKTVARDYKSADFCNNKVTNHQKENKVLINPDQKTCHKRDDGYDEIAIIGISGRFPGANTVHEYWENIVSGHCSISEIQRKQWQITDFYNPHPDVPNCSISKWGGLLDDIDMFDPFFFKISPLEAKMMDPQQRLMLMEGFKAFEDAGYGSHQLSGSKTGVFIGARNSDYLRYIMQTVPVNAQMFLGNDISIMAARIAYYFDLKGPCLTVDTACSSSLVALYQACQSLYQGTSDMVLTGGVFVMPTPEFYLMTSKTNMLSLDGECRTFDNAANGIVPGESVGALVLKKLNRALVDKDHIYGIIKGAAINQDGRTKGITAPSMLSQKKLICEAYENAKVDPKTVGYIEAHGTGTKLGDPIEFKALSQAFESFTKKKQFCAIGSHKPNIGHSITAAGMAGVMKIIMAMKYKKIPPTISIKQVNEHINFKKSPFYVNTKSLKWEKINGNPRRAGISSFGFSGTNCHIVIEEPPVCENTFSETFTDSLIPLSARTQEQLKIYCRNFADFLEGLDWSCFCTLSQIAYTLQTGRDIMPERLILVVSHLRELKDKLIQYTQNHPDIKGCYRGNTNQEPKDCSTQENLGTEYIKDSVHKGNMTILARAWASGKYVDWNLLYPKGIPGRISLPAYPFVKDSYWVSGPENSPFQSLTYRCHPMLEQNISTLQEQGFSTQLTGNEFYMSDHIVAGEKVLPGVAVIEMARAAGEILTNKKIQKLKNVFWQRPVRVGKQSREIQITLYPHGSDKLNFMSFKVTSPDDKAPGIVYYQGELMHSQIHIENQKINIHAIQNRCENKKDLQACYTFFKSMDLDYGASFQSIEELIFNKTEALGKLNLPLHLNDTLKDFVLHPSLMDGALQTVLVIASYGTRTVLPFSVEEIEIFKPTTPKSYAYAYLNSNANQSFNLFILDDTGRVCVKFHNFIVRELKDPIEKWFYVPGWTDMPNIPQKLKIKDKIKPKKVLMIYPENVRDLANILIKAHQKDNLVEIQLNTRTKLHLANNMESQVHNPGFWDDAFKEEDTPDVVYFLGGIYPREFEPDNLDLLEQHQNQGVICLFRLIRSLNKNRDKQFKTAQPIKIKLITNEACLIYPTQRVNPHAAAILGLARSATREYPGLLITCVDISFETKKLGFLAQKIIKLTTPKFDVFAIRGHRILKQTLNPVLLPKSKTTLFRFKGVYLILGGTGGIGLEMGQYLAKTYQARLILISRSGLTGIQKEKISRIHELGGEVLYLKSDASDMAGMSKSIVRAKNHFGKINGVIHSAIILKDKTISLMDENNFKAALLPKVRGSMVLYKVLKDEPLDFFLFFSSSQSFLGYAGQSNYASASCFEDAYALYLNNTKSFPIKVINWGYWGSVGVVSSKEYNRKMAGLGFQSIEPEQGMDAVERVLNHPHPQVVAINAQKKVIEQMGADFQYEIASYPRLFQPVISATTNSIQSSLKSWDHLTQMDQAFTQLDILGHYLLISAFWQMGVLKKKSDKYTRSQLKEQLGVIPFYQKLYEALLDILIQNDFIRFKEDRICITRTLMDSPVYNNTRNIEQTEFTLLRQYPEIKAHVKLLETCMRCYPEILTGRMSATDIMFADSSMELVEAIYKGNAAADYANELVVENVRTYVNDRLLALNPGQKINILEIGAGTGGTSASVLEALKEYDAHIRYVYTDISKAFIQYGKKNYPYSFADFRILDIEKPVVWQGYEAGAFDIVIAANVLHATQNIRSTLNHAKTLLKANGWLVLNEVTRNLDFLTFTFGLLEGWWIFNDKERLTHSPLLNSYMWAEILKQEGFEHVIMWNDVTQNKCLHDVISAQSNGVVKLPLTGQRLNRPLLAKKIQTQKKQACSQQVLSKELTDKFITDSLVELLCELLEINTQDIYPGGQFSDYGVDSILAVQFINRINENFEIYLKTTDLFDYVTIEDLSSHILEKYGKESGKRFSDISSSHNFFQSNFSQNHNIETYEDISVTGTKSHDLILRDKNKDIAVIGVSGRFPGAKNIDEFWENLSRGKNSVEKIWKERWDIDEYYDPNPEKLSKTYCKYGGFIHDIDKFDPLFFNITGKEAEVSDPQQRLFLEEAWNTLEDAGYANSKVTGTRCGVFVGVGPGDYQTRMRELGIEPIAQSFWGNTCSITPARISYFLNLKGPSVAVDTACSSSLVAIHLACQSLLSSECDMALAGGVYISVTPNFHILASNATMLSPKGCCKTFDNQADGFVPGEGVGVILLKPLDRAVKQRDHIYGIIKGSATNQDGKTHGITAPSTLSQTEVETAVYDGFHIDPETITYVEAHGTGTKLGDPIEIEALSNAFGKYTNKKQFCAIGSVKTNIGHAITAAGIASFIKILLMFKYKHIPPSLHFATSNEHIRFQESPFYVNTKLKKWHTGETSHPRRAGVSSFGFSGTNCHLVVEEYVQEKKQTIIPDQPRIFVLSAKKEEQLRSYAKKIFNFLQKELAGDSCKIDFADIIYTMQTSRALLSKRLAIIVSNLEELTDKLNRYYRGEKDIKDVYIQNESENKNIINLFTEEKEGSDYIQTIIQERNFSKLACLWVEGVDVDWDLLYKTEHPRRISLPSYPFAKNRYWIPGFQEKVSKQKHVRKFHPLIDTNEFSIEEIYFEKTLCGTEFYLTDHQVNHEKILPGVAYLEMARAAGNLASSTSQIAKIRNIVWAQPLKTDSSPVKITLILYPKESINPPLSLNYEIFTQPNKQDRVVHSRGKLIYKRKSPENTLLDQKQDLDIHAIQERCVNKKSKEWCYMFFRKIGLEYGPGFQPVEHLAFNETEAISLLTLPSHLKGGFKEFALHPSLMDGALQTVAFLLSAKEELFLPFSLGELEIVHSVPEKCYVYATLTEFSKTFNIQLLDQSGCALINMFNFAVRAVDKDDFAKHKASMYWLPVWKVWKEDLTTNMHQENIIIFDSENSLADAWQDRFPKARVFLIQPGEKFKKLENDLYSINPGNPEDYQVMLQKIQEKSLIPEYIIFNGKGFVESHKGTLTELPLESFGSRFPDASRNIYSLLYLSQALIKQKPECICLLYIHETKVLDVNHCFHTAINGFARTLNMENSKFTYKTIGILDLTETRTVLDICIREFQTNREPVEVRYNGNQRKRKCYQEHKPIHVLNNVLRKERVYLITGGLGELGKIFAKYFAQKWKSKVVLSGRSVLLADKRRELDKIRNLGVEVEYFQADISDWQEVKQLIGRIKSRFNGIHGILHTAGVIRDMIIPNKTKKDLQAVFAPKIQGLIYLDEITKNEDLDFFSFFSSLAGVLGNIGQCDYAYANSFMDNFAEIRENLRERGIRSGTTVSINWPLWQSGGMLPDEHAITWLKTHWGMDLLESKTGISGFIQALNLNANQVMIVKGDSKRFYEQFKNKWDQQGDSNMANDLPSDPTHDPSLVKGALGTTRQELFQLCADLLKVKIKDLDLDVELAEYGMDSIMMMNMLNRVEELYNITVEPDSISQYPTISRFAEYLVDKCQVNLKNMLSKTKQLSVLPLSSETKHTHPFSSAFIPPSKIAVVGMACRFPGAKNIEIFWKNLENCKASISQVPLDRWDISDYYSPDKNKPNKTYSKWGGYMDHIDLFDAAFFGISDEHAVMMDPQHRIMLELTQELLDMAGYSKSEMENTRTSVFLGGAESSYIYQNLENIPADHMKYIIVNRIQNMMASRISDFYNLKSVSQTIDTACSSSLVALHYACEEIRKGACDTAVAGGSELLLDPFIHIGFSKSGALSDDDKSYVFDEHAKGFVLGEGAGLVMLKPFEKAMEDGDRILGLILGSAVNNDGHTMGLTVPGLGGQKRVIEQAIHKAGVNPDTITYLEAHGTGTLLGDPVEIKAATQVYEKFTSDKQYCAVGSVKSNIGHLLHAAGIASFIKILLCMQHNKIPATLNCDTPHPRFNFNKSPFYPITQTKKWEGRNGIKRAGISSFGFGGTNCHMIVEDFSEAKNPGYIQKRDAVNTTCFQKKRYWLEKPVREFFKPEKYLNEYRKTFVYDEPILKDHQIFGKQILMGVVHCSLAIDAAKAAYPDQVLYGMEKISFHAPIHAAPSEKINVFITFKQEKNRILFKNSYRKTSQNELKQTASGELLFHDSSDIKKQIIDMESVCREALKVMSGDDFYKTQECYGPSLFTIKKVFQVQEGVIGEIRLSPQMLAQKGSYTIHPAFFDAASVTMNFLESVQALNSREIYIPLFIKRIRILGKILEPVYCWCKLVKQTSELITADTYYYTEQGRPIMYIEGLSVKRITSNPSLSNPSLSDQDLSGQVLPGQLIFPLNQEKNEAKTFATGHLEQYIKKIIQPFMKSSNEKFSMEKTFMDLGMNSLQLIEVTRIVEKQLGIELYPTLFFEYQNVKELAGFLKTKHFKVIDKHLPASEVLNSSDHQTFDHQALDPVPMNTVKSPKQDPNPLKTRDIAIIGMAGRFPGSGELEEFWANLEQCRDLIRKIPESRWDYKSWYSEDSSIPDTTYSKWGSFMDRVDQFDPLFFEIAPEEAIWLDPQTRVLMETIYQAMEDAGYGSHIMGTRTGLFVGSCFHEYWDELIRTHIPITDLQYSINSMAGMVGRLSYTFDLHGPSIPLDNACASSLTSIHLACQALRNNECDMAFAAGVNLLLSPLHYVGFSKLRVLSPTGRCRAFDKSADGYVPGEGVAVLLLKPLLKAIEDRDNIHAVVKGSQINHSGRANSPVAPRTSLQTELLIRAWDDAGIDPGTLAYVETQGVGSIMGDAVEVNALLKAFKKFTEKKHFCAIGSLKTNLGHLEGAAGIAGIIKVILSMKHNKIPPMAHFQNPSPYINLHDSPVFINTETIQWPHHEKFRKRAGISAFGLSGHNAHVVIEEYVRASQENTNLAENKSKSFIFVLSAKDQKQLKQYAEKMAVYFKKHFEYHQTDLTDIAYTLQTGRTPLEKRMAFCFSTKNELTEMLMRYSRNESMPDNFFVNEIQIKSESEDPIECIENPVTQKELEKLAKFWVAGMDIDWTRLYFGYKPNRVSLPVYPFKGETYWMPKPDEGYLNTPKSKPVVLEPVLIEKPRSQNENQGIRSVELLKQKLVRLVSKVLKLEQNQLNMDINLKKYGMNSLSGMKVLNRLQEAYQKKIPAVDFFKCTTITQVAEYLIRINIHETGLQEKSLSSSMQEPMEPEMSVMNENSFNKTLLKEMLRQIEKGKITPEKAMELQKQIFAV